MNVEVNLIGVLLATVSSMAIGTLWYAPKVFGDSWMKLAKVDKKKGAKNMPKLMGLALVSSLVMAYVLAHVTYLSYSFFTDSFLQNALSTGFWMWFGFQGLRLWMHNEFDQKPGKVSMIHAGNDFVTIMFMALVIGLAGI